MPLAGGGRSDSLGPLMPKSLFIALVLLFSANLMLAAELTRRPLPQKFSVLDIAAGPNGATFVAGSTTRAEYLPRPLRRFHAAGSQSHGAIIKYDAQGHALRSLVIGRHAVISHVAVAPDGDVVVLGQVYAAGLPVQNALQGRFGGEADLFIARFDNQLSTLRFCTYLGGRVNDSPAGLAVDAAGDIYVAGNFSSHDVLGTNVVQLGEDKSAVAGAMVIKLRADGKLVYASRLGSSWQNALAVDAEGHAVVVGNANTGDLPLVNAAQPFSLGQGGAFVSRLAPDGQSLVFSTLLGGACYESANDVAVADGRIVVAGSSCADRFHLDSLVSDYSKTRPFLATFDLSGQLFRTNFITLSERDIVRGLAVGDGGEVYFGGDAGSDGNAATLIGCLKPDGTVLTQVFPSACGDVPYVYALAATGDALVLAGTKLDDAFTGNPFLSRLNLNALHEPLAASVVLTHPVRGQVTAPNESLTLRAAVWNASAMAVSFYDGETLIGTATNFPFTLDWSSAVAGAHSLKAVAEVNGEALSSCVVPVTISSPPNDNFADRIQLRRAPVTARGSLAGSTGQEFESSYWPQTSVWWEWIAPSDGTFQAEAIHESGQWLNLTAFTGSAPEELSPVSAPSQYQAIAFRARAGQTYVLRVSSSVTIPVDPLNYRLRIKRITPPPNDEFANAKQITGSEPQVAGTLKHATVESDWTGDTRPGVWYSWTAAANGQFLAALANGNLASVAVYRGTTLTNLESIGSSVYGSTNGSRFTAEAGTTYFLHVSSYYSSLSSNFTLRLHPLAAPGNDLFNNAITLTGDNVSVVATTLGAQRDPGEPIDSSRPWDAPAAYAWWNWTAPQDGVFAISAFLLPQEISSGAGGVPGSPSAYAMRIFTGDSLNTLSNVSSVRLHSVATFRAKEGVIYRIGVVGNLLPFTLRIDKVEPPVNDDFVNATQLTGSELLVAVPLRYSTFEAGEAAGVWPDYYSEGGSVWYRWTAPSDGVFAFLNGAGDLRLYTGSALPSLVSLSYSSRRPVVRLTAGQQVAIRVRGNSTTYLHIAPVMPPPNDDFAAREVLSEIPVTFMAETRNATREPQENNATHGTVWYSWTAPSNGTYVIRREFGGYYSPFAFYGNVTVQTGTALGELQYVAYSWNEELSFEAQAGITYQISVEGDGYYNSPAVFTLMAAPQPLNDHFAQRTELTGESVSLVAFNKFATIEDDEPCCTRGSVWWSWTAPRDGRVAFRVEPLTSYGDPAELAIFTGDQFGALSPVVQTPFETSRLDVEVEAGVTYLVRVGTPSGNYADWVQFRLRIDYLPSPANDLFENRTAIQHQRASGTTSGAMMEIDEPNPSEHFSGQSVWWTWSPAQSGSFDLLLHTTAEIVATIYTGDSFDGLNALETSGSPHALRFAAEAGEVYTIQLIGPYAMDANYELELVRLNPPANDNFANRTQINGTNALLTGRNAEATPEPDEPAHDVEGAQRSIWWTWTAPRDGTALFSIEGGVKNIAVYRGETLSELFLVESGETVRFCVVSGQTFQIVVDEFVESEPTPDPWQLRLDFAHPPENDHLTNRTQTPGIPVDVTGRSVGATREYFGEMLFPATLGQSTWWEWTPPVTGSYRFRVFATNGLPILGLFRGATWGTIETFAFTAGTGHLAEIVADVQAGEAIVVLVDAWLEAPSDRYRLLIEQVFPPFNDNFADRAALENGRGESTLLGATGESAGSWKEATNTASIWWGLTPPSNGWYSITSTVTNDSLGVMTHFRGIYRGESLTNLVLEWNYSGNSTQYVFLYAGVEYALRISSTTDRIGDVFVQVGYQPPPINDDFTNATELTGESLEIKGTTEWSSLESGESPLAWDHYSGGWYSVWWRWTAPSNGVFLVTNQPVPSVPGPPFPPTPAPSVGPPFFQMYTGTAISNLTQVTNVAYGSPGDAQLFRLTGGVTYYFRVSRRTFSSAPFAFRIFRVQPPENDDFANRILVAGTSFTVVASNHFATVEPGDPLRHELSQQTLWWRWIAPESGTYTFTGWHRTGVFTGDAITNLVLVYAPQSGGSNTFNAVAGTEYQIGATTMSNFAGDVGFRLNLVSPELAAAPIRARLLILRLPTERASIVETSTNLVDWLPFNTNSPSTGELRIEPKHDDTQRFFRVR